MLSFAYAKRLERAKFPRPKQFVKGQHWYTPEGKLGVVIGGNPDAVLLQFATSTSAQFMFSSLVYAPTVEEILSEIARAGKYRLLGKQPGASKFEVNGSNLHQYAVERRAANALAKEFCNIAKEG